MHCYGQLSPSQAPQKDKYPYVANLGGENVWFFRPDQVVTILRNFYAVDTSMAICIVELYRAQATIDTLKNSNTELKQEVKKAADLLDKKDEAFLSSMAAMAKLSNELELKYLDCSMNYSALKKKNFFQKIGDWPSWGPIKIRNVLYFGAGIFVGYKIGQL